MSLNVVTFPGYISRHILDGKDNLPWDFYKHNILKIWIKQLQQLYISRVIWNQVLYPYIFEHIANQLYA